MFISKYAAVQNLRAAFVMSVVATMTHVVEELLSKPCRKIMTQSPHIVVDITVILDDPRRSPARSRSSSHSSCGRGDPRPVVVVVVVVIVVVVVAANVVAVVLMVVVAVAEKGVVVVVVVAVALGAVVAVVVSGSCRNRRRRLESRTFSACTMLESVQDMFKAESVGRQSGIPKLQVVAHRQGTSRHY